MYTVANQAQQQIRQQQIRAEIQCFLIVLVGIEETVPLTQDWQSYKMTQSLTKI